MISITQDNRHRLEKSAIELEQSATHCSQFYTPWYDRKVASAYRRAAKILRKALEEE